MVRCSECAGLRKSLDIVPWNEDFKVDVKGYCVKCKGKGYINPEVPMYTYDEKEVILDIVRKIPVSLSMYEALSLLGSELEKQYPIWKKELDWYENNI